MENDKFNLSFQDRVNITYENVARAKGVHLLKPTYPFHNPNEYMVFLKRCISHAEKVGDHSIEYKLRAEYEGIIEIEEIPI